MPKSAFSLMHPLRRPRPRLISCLTAGLLFFATTVGHALDSNGNQMSDVWEMIFNAQGLSPNLDTDGDGFLNVREALAGTDPFDPQSHPTISIVPAGTNSLLTTWNSSAGKLYDLQESSDLASWQTVQTTLGNGGTQSFLASLAGETNLFFHLLTSDQASENVQLSIWEKVSLGFSPTSAHTDRFDQIDISRIIAGIAPNASNVITVSAIKPEISERWPEHGVIAFRRAGGGLRPLTIQFTLDGTATDGIDYTRTPAIGNSIFLPAEVREVWLECAPVADAEDSEPNETITVSLQPGSGYTLGPNTAATITLANETASSSPSAKAAARFLVQAAFGPDGVNHRTRTASRRTSRK